MKPTKANKSGKATAADTVYTNHKTAIWIVDYFKPVGSILQNGDGFLIIHQTIM